MSTIRQKKLAEAVVNNFMAEQPLNKQELVASVGYSTLSADRKATEILESKGTQEELALLGFDSINAKRVVAEALNDPKAQWKDRLKAADMVFDVNGDKAPEKHIVVTKKLIQLDD